MYFIDVQGTLIDDLNRKPIHGAIELIDKLNAKKIAYMVITNNTKHASNDFLAYLNSVGLNINADHYLDPLMIIEQNVQKKAVAAYGTKEFLSVLKDMGYNLNYTNPDEVLLSIKNDFCSDEFADMIGFLLSGAKLTGMHETTIYSKNSKRYPGVGAMLKMLEFATSASYAVVGKPSRNFYNRALQIIKKQDENLEFEDITIISDDVKGDLVGAKELNMKTVFVLSGKYKRADEIIPFLTPEESPEHVYEDINEFLVKGTAL